MHYFEFLNPEAASLKKIKFRTNATHDSMNTIAFLRKESVNVTGNDGYHVEGRSVPLGAQLPSVIIFRNI